MATLTFEQDEAKFNTLKSNKKSNGIERTVLPDGGWKYELQSEKNGVVAIYTFSAGEVRNLLTLKGPARAKEISNLLTEATVNTTKSALSAVEVNAPIALVVPVLQSIPAEPVQRGGVGALPRADASGRRGTDAASAKVDPFSGGTGGPRPTSSVVPERREASVAATPGASEEEREAARGRELASMLASGTEQVEAETARLEWKEIKGFIRKDGSLDENGIKKYYFDKSIKKVRAETSAMTEADIKKDLESEWPSKLAQIRTLIKQNRIAALKAKSFDLTGLSVPYGGKTYNIPTIHLFKIGEVVGKSDSDIMALIGSRIHDALQKKYPNLASDAYDAMTDSLIKALGGKKLLDPIKKDLNELKRTESASLIRPQPPKRQLLPV